MARTVGDLIAEARSRAKGYGRRGMSQMDLARAIGMDNRSWLAQVEAGNIEKPAPERLQAIADVLPTVSFRDLLAASDQLDVLAQPAGESKPQPTAPAPDLAALIAAMTAQAEQQTKAMAQQAQLIALLTEQNAMLKRWLAPGWAPEADAADPSARGAGPLPPSGIGRAVRGIVELESAPAPVDDPSSAPGTAAGRRGPR